MLVGGHISRRDAPTYDALVALDSHSNKHADGGAATAKSNPMPKLQQKLQRLSSIRVYALEAVPGQTGLNGVPFMGRGTPSTRGAMLIGRCRVFPYVRSTPVDAGATCLWTQLPRLMCPPRTWVLSSARMQVDAQMSILMATPVFAMRTHVSLVSPSGHSYAQQQQQDCLAV